MGSFQPPCSAFQPFDKLLMCIFIYTHFSTPWPSLCYITGYGKYFLTLYVHYRLNHLMIGQLMNHQFERILYGSGRCQVKVLFRLPWWLRKLNKNLSAVGIHTEIRSRCFPNISLKLNRYTNLVGNVLQFRPSVGDKTLSLLIFKLVYLGTGRESSPWEI
jgi:hypothetical protein